jgi:magnesium transporter
VITKEALVGLVNGLAVGLMACGVVSIWFGIQLGAVLGLTMVLSLFLAALLGTLIPLLLKQLRFDSALASSVLVIAFTDVITFLFYLGLATLLRRQLDL